MTEHSQGSGRPGKKRRASSKEFRSADHSFRLVITHDLMVKMKESCARAHPLETGGILIGHYNREHDTALLSQFVSSPADSRSGATTFHRGTRGLQGLLNRVWKRREYYLGEWHCHPCASAQPSATDTKQMQVIADDEDAGCPEPVLVILGKDGAITAHVYPRGRRALQLSPVSASHPCGGLE